MTDHKITATLTRKQILDICDCLNARAQNYEARAINIGLGAINGDRAVMDNAAGDLRATSQQLLAALAKDHERAA